MQCLRRCFFCFMLNGGYGNHLTCGVITAGIRRFVFTSRLLPWGRVRLPVKWRVGVILRQRLSYNPSLHPPVGRESHISTILSPHHIYSMFRFCSAVVPLCSAFSGTEQRNTYYAVAKSPITQKHSGLLVTISRRGFFQ
jgi:hypothetical protein